VTLTTSAIPGLQLVHRGKVRETYSVGDDRLLLVATDRLSAFDVVFDQPIPDKGRLLTALSGFWFRRLASLGPTHFVSTDLDDLPPAARSSQLDERVTLARRARRIDA
jgi:phosphoribosylaminoimidazole-succinocarboxamide synthase